MIRQHLNWSDVGGAERRPLFHLRIPYLLRTEPKLGNGPRANENRIVCYSYDQVSEINRLCPCCTFDCSLSMHKKVSSAR